ncbi:hypothetical protein GCM10011491_33020 [Brucella endophytica]|uniref:Uncharacterized protein n=1 Tax=Brucella endophytica TaxID=1963359 RepID=A0A916WJ55_9HYPH|nr:hypothetical protein GCM10011491_33020 [Brucella endophytica]
MLPHRRIAGLVRVLSARARCRQLLWDGPHAADNRLHRTRRDRLKLDRTERLIDTRGGLTDGLAAGTGRSVGRSDGFGSGPDRPSWREMVPTFALFVVIV